MGPKKAAAPSPEPVVEAPKVVEEPPAEQLDGEFAFPDGSDYVGQYLKKANHMVFHGTGRLQTGPEVFEGTFEDGFYKAGTYKSCNGSIYKGSFRKNQFHGQGEYIWPDQRKYSGMWKDGSMHGRGRFENFSFGVDRVFEGFSVRGNFLSSTKGQEEAQQAFLRQYGAEYGASASAVLVNIAAKCGTLEPPDPKAKKPVEDPLPEIPKEVLVPNAPADGEAEDTAADAEHAAVEEFVLGPFPQASVFKMATLKAFGALFEKPEGGGNPPGKVICFEDQVQSRRFDASRLRKEQLMHLGQGIELWAPNAEPGSISAMVFVNVSTEPDSDKAQWKIVSYQEVPVPQDEAPADGKKGK